MPSLSSLTDALLVAWLRFGRYPWSRFRRMLEWRYAHTPLPSIGSLPDLEEKLSQITWTLDGPLHLYDAISRPQTTWGRKRDDCDGFAVLAATLLQRCDPDTKPAILTVMLRPVKESHTVCVFKTARGIRMTDNSHLRPEVFADYHGAAEAVAERGERVVCWDVVDPKSLRTLQFHRV